MTAEDLEQHLRAIGLTVERIAGHNGGTYTVARDVQITTGGLRGRSCDVALRYVTTLPYVLPSAIHTRPALVRMAMTEPLKTQRSPIGPQWQYWSRRLDDAPTPQRIWAHVLTVLGDHRWEPA